MQEKSKKLKRLSDGWTFIETLIVMSIILLLSTTVGFSAVKQLDKARVVAAKNQIETLGLALDSYYFDIGHYPSETDGLSVLWTNVLMEEKWNGPYLTKKIPADPWGNNYVYICPGINGLGYGIISYGKDAVEGGDGVNADIYSWE